MRRKNYEPDFIKTLCKNTINEKTKQIDPR